MPSLGDSIRRYVRYVARKWWQLAIGVLAALISVATDIWTDLRVPASVWIGAGLAALIAAQFVAFRRLHVDLNAQVADARSTIAELEAEAQARYQLSVKPLSASFDLHTFRHLLESSQKGLAVRCVIGTIWEGQQLEVPGSLKTGLRDGMGVSSLQGLLAHTLGMTKDEVWEVSDPTGEWVVAVSRGREAVPTRKLEMDAQVLVEVPFPGSRRGWIATIVDLALHASGESVSPVWDLRSLYEFTDSLTASTMELHLMGLSHIADDERQLVGPVIAFAAHNSHLDDYIEYPKWDRARGVTGSSYLTIDPGDEDQATLPERRRRFLAAQLRGLVAREGFVGFEEDYVGLLGL